jgi:hypothetical protein
MCYFERERRLVLSLGGGDEAARFHHTFQRRRRGMVAHSARAAPGDARDWIPRNGCTIAMDKARLRPLKSGYVNMGG